MSHKFEVKDSKINGKGLFATSLIKQGEAVVTWHPKVITKAEAAKLPDDEQRHYLYPEGDNMLWMQPPERYMNHSCDANTHVVGRSDVASRDIVPGEEITSDYLDLDTEDFACNCGAKNCRRPAALERQVQSLFGLQNVKMEQLDIPVNDVIKITTPSGTFALKIYNIQSRTVKDVQWELDLIEHLIENNVPVVKPVRGRHGYIEVLHMDGQERAAALFEWVAGEKPQPSHETYVLLGEAAARIHAAADTFHPAWIRENYDATRLIDEQIERMKKHLAQTGRYEQMLALGERLKIILANPALDQGICHMDLTLDNIHIADNRLTVFDFDSSGWCWRAVEPYGVRLFSEDYFNDWLQGYRSVRPFSEDNEKAVQAFGIIGDIRNVVWKLGEARSSRGKPLLTAHDLPQIIDGWLDLERHLPVI